MIRYPRDWAATHGMTHDRVEMDDAISFVGSLQSYEFGTLIESHNQHVEAGTDPDDDPAMQTERDLQSDLERVKAWLQSLQDDGQETISTRKVRSRIETETGYELVLD